MLGAIDFDPCSEAVFNEVVRADLYYSLEDRDEDALILPWPAGARTHCNPPGGFIREFWLRALDQPIGAMTWVGFSVEQLNLLSDEPAHPLDFSNCMLRSRVGFTRHDGYEGSPSHGNYVCGVAVDHAAFEREFAPLGKVTAGKYAVGVRAYSLA